MQTILSAILFLITTILLSLNRFDDLVYELFDRSPTSVESVKRVVYVFAKALTCLYCGSIFAVIFKRMFIEKNLQIPLTAHQNLLLIIACMVLVFFLLGLIQNAIRKLQGRPLRPILDRRVFLRGIRSWIRTLAKDGKPR